MSLRVMVYKNWPDPDEELIQDGIDVWLEKDGKTFSSIERIINGQVEWLINRTEDGKFLIKHGDDLQKEFSKNVANFILLKDFFTSEFLDFLAEHDKDGLDWIIFNSTILSGIYIDPAS